MERTADGNTDGRGILPGSYQLGEGMYAFTAGGPFSARVVYSTDGGESWCTTADLPFEAGVRARFVSFYSETGGWLAVGGGRLMGSEGYLLARTQDGGQSWQRVELPPELAFSHLMDGIAFADESRGFLSFDVMDREPDYWYTADGGATFTQVELPMPQELLNTFYKVDSLAFDPVTGQGQLVVGQGPYGGKKAVFTSEDGGLHWAFEEMREESGHYVG